jgi:hypothetical protein
MLPAPQIAALWLMLHHPSYHHNWVDSSYQDEIGNFGDSLALARTKRCGQFPRMRRLLIELSRDMPISDSDSYYSDVFLALMEIADGHRTEKAGQR